MSDIVRRLRKREGDWHDPIYNEAADEIERLTEVLQTLEGWSQTHSSAVFPDEPDLKKAHELLQAGGMTLEAVGASAMRHVITRIGEVARKALEGK